VPRGSVLQTRANRVGPRDPSHAPQGLPTVRRTGPRSRPDVLPLPSASPAVEGSNPTLAAGGDRPSPRSGGLRPLGLRHPARACSPARLAPLTIRPSGRTALADQTSRGLAGGRFPQGSLTPPARTTHHHPPRRLPGTPVLAGRGRLRPQPRGTGHGLESVVESLHLNPVRRKRVARPEDWEWSSARSYAGHQPVLIGDGRDAPAGRFQPLNARDQSIPRNWCQFALLRRKNELTPIPPRFPQATWYPNQGHPSVAPKPRLSAQNCQN